MGIKSASGATEIFFGTKDTSFSLLFFLVSVDKEFASMLKKILL
jgi:hypothetical protein